MIWLFNVPGTSQVPGTSNWQALRNRKLAGLKFYRQHPFGRYVVDFYSHEKRLVIEVDGGIHLKKDVKEYDQERQKLIELYDVRFFRCTPAEVENDLEGVLIKILEAAELTPAFGNPSLGRDGDRGRVSQTHDN